MNAEIRISSYSPSHARAIADLYHAAVHGIDSLVYSKAQKEAWAPTPPDYTFWAKRLQDKQPFVALVDERVAGFMELEADGHIDCAYTHPDFQGSGVASALYQHLESQATAKGIDSLYVEASIVAKPFFEHRDFMVLRSNKVYKKGLELINFSMEKPLSGRQIADTF
ncbi:hypothetical protein HMF8227_01298 [Saliniradius amylolyticus]|uniref:N-acetyltransferase domain-containing protein n=1 Tax=Saliniradius amylolyticus TaxID=2183582 RepID=A0A2S2E298_9ALTE|nr:GNAT family N-acetyltransferase [Saliniradius amylolyticus]AWL11776.1 hypothetical protein HMF8227_01298 [Saliniradius amylolyticus]